VWMPKLCAEHPPETQEIVDRVPANEVEGLLGHSAACLNLTSRRYAMRAWCAQ
jgi:hypothetical protein